MHIYMYICIYIHVCVYVYVVCMYIDMHIDLYVYVHVSEQRTCIYTHEYTPAGVDTAGRVRPSSFSLSSTTPIVVDVVVKTLCVADR